MKDDINTPTPTFTPWIMWGHWKPLAKLRPVVGGIYILSSGGTAGPADPRSEDVILINMTQHSTVQDEFHAFARSAFLDNARHSLGSKFYEEFMQGTRNTGPPGWLHYAVRLDEDLENLAGDARDTYLSFRHQELLYRFAKKHNRLPVCNAR